ncbi:DNA repair family protein [Viridothelium virens]|uniref:DNA repair family protein n=1 Tax=Viridothelium virens TaxID=1048519 RepID=A0A6A6H3B0_VIRVR|nr:DNA repair family protein [Viridothelium virens]
MKRTIDGFFKPNQKSAPPTEQSTEEPSKHETYPLSVAQFPASISDALGFAPATDGRLIDDRPDLDIVYYQPYIPKEIEKELFQFLRCELFFYRVQYNIKRGPVETQINTPRFTTVFGVDESSYFSPQGHLLDAVTKRPIPKDRYKCKPRPIPGCLDQLRKITERTTDQKFNFCLVNYYANGNDSISYHSDDERFLGSNPAIASFSLGARRDFLMKHKPPNSNQKGAIDSEKPLKLPLASGDMLVMRGPTQSNWLHSIPKRKGKDSDRGRINITFRRAMVRGGTENYYTYNVGSGGVFKWSKERQEMVAWTAGS